MDIATYRLKQPGPRGRLSKNIYSFLTVDSYISGKERSGSLFIPGCLRLFDRIAAVITEIKKSDIGLT